MAEMSEQSSFERELESARLAAIVANSNDAIVSKTLDGIVTSWNEAATRIFGYSPDEIVGQSIKTIIPKELQAEEDEILRRLRRGEQVDHFDTIRRAKDGRLIPVSITVSPLRNSRGDIIGASKIARDITDRKRSEERQTLLLNELRHRVKNMLSVVGAVARRSFSGPEHSLALETFGQRLLALSVAYEYLVEDKDAATTLDRVVQSVLAPFQTFNEAISIVGRADINLQSKQAISVALAVNELATNATKYGALSTKVGEVEVTWDIVDDFAEFRWIERNGPVVEPPSRKGFGSVVLSSLKHELNAEIELLFAPSGVRFTARFPCPGLRD